MNRFLVTLATIALTGCAGATVTTLKTAAAKPADCQFDVFTSEAEVGRKFETLCIVEAHTSTRMFADRTINGAISEAKPRICECGADAAILVNGSSDTSSGWLPASYKDIRGNATLRGIRYVADSATKPK